MYSTMSTYTTEDIAKLQAMLQSQEVRDKIGMKYAPRARLGVSEKQNLILSEKQQNGAVGKNTDGSYYYMAGVRGKGTYRSTPFPALLKASKEGLDIMIHFAFDNDYERTLYNEWVKGVAKPTFVSAKSQSTAQSNVSAAIPETPTATPTPAPIQTVSQVTGVSLNPLQRLTLKKVLE